MIRWEMSDKTTPYALVLEQRTYALNRDGTLIEPADYSVLTEVEMKFDGCVHLWQYYQTDKEADPDYLYLCGIDLFIEQLEMLRDRAREKFGQEWGAKRAQ